MRERRRKHLPSRDPGILGISTIVHVTPIKSISYQFPFQLSFSFPFESPLFTGNPESQMIPRLASGDHKGES